MIHAHQEKKTEILRMNQDQWIQHFNDKKTKMVSCQDFFKEKKLHQTLMKELTDSWIVTSTRIVYKGKKADITHDFGSTVVKPKTYKNITVPVWSGDFKLDKTTENYLQALFDTKLSLKSIIAKLKKLTKQEVIRLWTPSLEARKERPVCAVCLYFGYGGRFSVGGDRWCDNGSGFSHGVLSDSAKRSKGWSQCTEVIHGH